VAANIVQAGIERLLAERFPQPDVPARVREIAPMDATDEPAARSWAGRVSG
jgi:hypothetical protein